MNWKESFKIHLVKMDQYFQKYKPPFKSDIKVYLAGYYARYLDEEYKNQIQPYIIENLEYFKQLIKKHHLKLGQNASIFYYAKINAEYRMFNILQKSITQKEFHSFTLNYELSEPASLYLLASTYYRLSGKIYNALIFEYIYKRIREIFLILNLYSKAVELDQSKEKITQEELENFINNLKKELSQENQISIEQIQKDPINQILSKLFYQS